MTNPTVETTSITTTARENVTDHSNQESQDYIVTGHKVELFTKDQPSMGDNITTTARGYVSDHSNQESQEYIMMGHKAELFNKDKPSMGNILTTNAGKDMNKEKEHDVVMNNYTEKDRRAFLKAV